MLSGKASLFDINVPCNNLRIILVRMYRVGKSYAEKLLGALGPYISNQLNISICILQKLLNGKDDSAPCKADLDQIILFNDFIEFALKDKSGCFGFLLKKYDKLIHCNIMMLHNLIRANKLKMIGIDFGLLKFLDATELSK